MNLFLRRATDDAVALGRIGGMGARNRKLACGHAAAGNPARAPEALRLVPGQINRLEELLSA